MRKGKLGVASSKPFRIGNWWYLETTNFNNDLILKRSRYQVKLNLSRMETVCKVSVDAIERFNGLQIGFLGKVAVVVLHSELDPSYKLIVIALETAEVLTTVDCAGKDICLSADDLWLYYLSLNAAGSPKELRKRSTAYPSLDIEVKTLQAEEWPAIDVLPSRRFIFLHEGNNTFIISTGDGATDIPQLCAHNVRGLKKIQDVRTGENPMFIGYGSDGLDRQYVILVQGVEDLVESRDWEYVRVGITGVIADLVIYNDEIILIIRVGGNEHALWAKWTEFASGQNNAKWTKIPLDAFVHHTNISFALMYSPQSCQLMLNVCCPACETSSHEYLGKGAVNWCGEVNGHYPDSTKPAHHISFFEAGSCDDMRIPVTLVCPENNMLNRHGNNVAMILVYGSYGENLEPTYDSSIQYLISNGVYVAYAHVRGGGELGAGWHRAGQRENKQNTINDYIAVSTAVKQEIGGDDACVIAAGASAGGAIAAAALNQRPDLYDGGFLVAPFISPMRAILDVNNSRSLIDQREFGRVQFPAELKSLELWSPLENVMEQPYPPVCIAINELDTNINNSDVEEYAEKMEKNGTEIFISMRRGATHGFVSSFGDGSSELKWLLAFQHAK